MNAEEKEKPVKKYELDILTLQYENLSETLHSIDGKIDNFVTAKQLEHAKGNMDTKIRQLDEAVTKDMKTLENSINLKYGPALGLGKWIVLSLLSGAGQFIYLIVKGVL